MLSFQRFTLSNTKGWAFQITVKNNHHKMINIKKGPMLSDQMLFTKQAIRLRAEH